jgi:LytS/YehU family sensor histidine kinase
MDEAYSHISKFSRLLRSYIKSSRNKLITIEEEIKNLKDYIELQQNRYEGKFEYVIDIDPFIDPRLTMIPSLLLQPFVENAINHGLLLKKGKGLVSIKFMAKKGKNEITCIIEDNGVGRKFSKSLYRLEPNTEKSYGDLLIKDLVSIFNKFEQMNINITLTDKEEPLTGTIVTILIKNPRHDS